MSHSLPGTPADDLTPQEALKELERLKSRIRLPKADDAKPATIHVTSDRDPKCFVIMSFGRADLEVVFEDFVRPVLVNDCKLICRRGDDIFGSGAIIDDVRKAIAECDLAVADLTGQNANVFYELGICHTLGKPVLMLAQSKEDIPFDVRHLRVLLYEYTPRGCKTLEKAIKAHIDTMLVR
ncbi:MAG: hypothetical protein KDE53_31685 [Caldilineaceae bacterium]|nr:hypothetical protein [Caldilineaceae bacterium]